MPLRDHFRPTRRRWRQVHASWPITLLARLEPVLPPGYVAGPSVQLRSEFEVDVGAVDADAPAGFHANGSGGTATATLTAPPPTLVADGAFLDDDDELALEVTDPAGTLVAAVEFVSPRNKDRPDARGDFVAKCTALLRRGVCVAVVDVVTDRTANLYAATLDNLGVADPALGAEPSATYAATLRRREVRAKYKLDAWAYPLDIGRPIPALPLWLTEDLWVSLDLEGSYEDACRIIRLP